MKERQEKSGVVEEVISDEALMQEIKDLVSHSMKKGYKKSWIIDTISQKWMEMTTPTEEVVINLKCDEIEFFEKIDRFCHDFGEAFIVRENWYFHGMNLDNLGSFKRIEEYEQITRESLIASFKSIYYIFCREDTITVKKIEATNKKLFKKRILFIDTFVAECALGDIFIIDGKPTYILDQEKRTKLEPIDSNEDFKKFCEKYSYRNTRTNRVSLKLIWLISKYY